MTPAAGAACTREASTTDGSIDSKALLDGAAALVVRPQGKQRLCLTVVERAAAREGLAACKQGQWGGNERAGSGKTCACCIRSGGRHAAHLFADGSCLTGVAREAVGWGWGAEDWGLAEAGMEAACTTEPKGRKDLSNAALCLTTLAA
jgi:hypothetical protein